MEGSDDVVEVLTVFWRYRFETLPLKTRGFRAQEQVILVLSWRIERLSDRRNVEMHHALPGGGRICRNE